MRFKLIKSALFVIIAMICLSSSVSYAAANTFDPDAEGEISVTMRYNSETVAGGNLILFRVGDVVGSDNSLSFELDDTYKNSNADLTDITSSSLVKALEKFAVDKKIEGTEIEIDSNGEARFRQVTPGIYMICQTKAAKDFNKIASFIVTVPMNNGGAYLYEIDASPKVQLSKSPKDTTPVFTIPSEKPKQGRLPQTGQVNWPVPVLIAVGLLLLVIGWLLILKHKRRNN